MKGGGTYYSPETLCVLAIKQTIVCRNAGFPGQATCTFGVKAPLAHVPSIQRWPTMLLAKEDPVLVSHHGLEVPLLGKQE